MKNKLDIFRFTVGIDTHILSTLLFRGWNVVAGGVTILLMPLYLNPVEQGYYFTFASLLAIQVFFELGLNQVLLQLVSHEAAHLKTSTHNYFSGDRSHLDRLSSLVIFIRRWYSVAAIFFGLIACISGVIFFDQKKGHLNIGVWVTLVVATAINLWLSPKLTIFEGIGGVGKVARLRLWQSILGYGLFWTLLFSGVGLWSMTAIPITYAISTSWWIRARGRVLSWLSRRPINEANNIIWRADIFPLQWRISLSWMSGYFIFNLFTPMVFLHQGAIEAGRLGMAFSIYGAVITVGMSWVNAKAPNFTMLIAQGDKNGLNILFRALFFRSTVFIALISASIVLGVWFLDWMGVELVARISSPTVMFVMAIITIANSMVFCMATYMRAYREEPMLKQSITVGLLVSLAVYMGSNYGVLTMMILYMLICLFVSLPWAAWIYFKYTKRGA